MKQYRLSEFCELLAATIENEWPATYWVKAEIASLAYSGGHCYMDLIEKGAKDILAAKMRATCWSNNFRMIAAYFTQETGETLRNGMQILVEVTVILHPVYGLSLNIQNIDPQYTMGDLARQRLETIRKLEADGVMEMNKNLPLATIIRNIAVISAESAAGYGDFCNQLKNNEFGFTFKLSFFPALMQGDKAAASIINAIKLIAETSEPDVVVIIRGGGATTDLSCFDDYTLASFCAQFPFPVVSGIGHLRDVSVLDMVAHTALKTPTAVAEFIINHNAEQLAILQNLQQRIALSAEKFVMIRRQKLDNLRYQLLLKSQNFLAKNHDKLILMEKTIALHNPEKIFALGYSCTSINGKVLKSMKNLKPGDVITTEVNDGRFSSIVCAEK